MCAQVTQWMMQAYARDIKRVADGEEASPALKAECEAFQLTPLSEAEIEGYHAQVQKLVSRGAAAHPPWIFAQMRLGHNIERIRRWLSTPSGEKVVAHEWRRYKRVVRLPGNHEELPYGKVAG